MRISEAVLCILLTTFAASYAWGMRGAVIGGEKGAMLPGAFIGLILAWFSGGAIRENFWIPVAAGLMGMTYGGTEPYGETIGMVLNRGAYGYNPQKGRFGLAFKGALWFSICGGFIAISLASMTASIYTAKDIMFCLLIPVIQHFGYKIFNQPYDKEKGIYPRIFYSLTRREEWGSNLLLLIVMIIVAVAKGDNFTLAMIAGGFIFGAAGWFVAIKLYELSAFPMKNGRFILGKLSEKNLVDGWKIMEFALGAIGGFGLALTYCLRFEFVEKYNELIAAHGQILSYEKYDNLFTAVISLCVAGVLAINIYQFVCGKKGVRVDYFLWDRIERPLYNVVPMILVLLGSVFTAKVMTVFMLVFVCGIKCAFDRFEDAKLLPVGQTVVGAVCAVAFAGCFYDVYKPMDVIFVGTIPYLVAELASSVWETVHKGKKIADLAKTAFITVYPCFVVMSIMIIIFFYKIFVI